MCGDAADKGFQSLRLLEFGETVHKELGPTTCSTWIDFDLTDERVVGFAVTTSDYNYSSTITNIRAIAPIVDCPDCANTTPFINT